MCILLYRNINLKKYFLKNIKIANTNTFRLLFKYTNDNTGIGTFLEPIPPIPIPRLP